MRFEFSSCVVAISNTSKLVFLSKHTGCFVEKLWIETLKMENSGINIRFTGLFVIVLLQMTRKVVSFVITEQFSTV